MQIKSKPNISSIYPNIILIYSDLFKFFYSTITWIHQTRALKFAYSRCLAWILVAHKNGKKDSRYTTDYNTLIQKHHETSRKTHDRFGSGHQPLLGASSYILNFCWPWWTWSIAPANRMIRRFFWRKNTQNPPHQLANITTRVYLYFLTTCRSCSSNYLKGGQPDTFLKVSALPLTLLHQARPDLHGWTPSLPPRIVGKSRGWLGYGTVVSVGKQQTKHGKPCGNFFLFDYISIQYLRWKMQIH